MQYDLTAEQIDDALNGLTKSLRRGAVLNPLAWYETTVEEDAKAAGFDTARRVSQEHVQPARHTVPARYRL